MKNKEFFLLVVTLLVVLAGCRNDGKKLRLATTTSTYDSGLLDVLIPVFEQSYQVDVDIIAVGTGQAIALGESRDVDVILVHAREKEEQFVAEGYGTFRLDVMYNDFVIVGPSSDPAKIGELHSADIAFSQISDSQSLFVSRGDDSGTHFKELSLWEMAGIEINPDASWYKSIGQGMGDVLRFANETQSYTLTDRGTFLSLSETLPNLVILLGGESIGDNPDPNLYNPYSVIPVEPVTPGGLHELALEFSYWITDIEAQIMIQEFLFGNPGWPLFYPNSSIWNDSQ